MAAGEKHSIDAGVPRSRKSESAGITETAERARFDSAKEQLEDIARGASERTHRYGIRSQPNGPMPKTLDDSEKK